MPRTIDQGFSEFLTKLTPSATETEAAKDHRSSIETCLQTKFGMKRLFRTGSFGNGTSVSAFSDVDYFAEIPVSSLKQDSEKSLTEIAQALADTFWDTRVKVVAPAIKLFFANGEEITEVVPADNINTGKWGVVYDIPNTNGGWMKSSPEAHKEFVRYWDDQLENKVRPLVRFVKAWKFENKVPITSFYLELAVTSYARAEALAKKNIYYHIDIFSFLSQVLRNNLPDIDDPMGISGLIPACGTAMDRVEALSKLNRGHTQAVNAFTASKEGNLALAFDEWKRMLGSRFPNYYY
ncbi:MAG: nucleotidyltransferase [Elusimicrobiota bacterium]|nr:nucleotidyltransferase [Elusimicrobiota bacterium]